MTVRIVIADDHEPIRRKIRSVLAERDAWSVCGEAKDGLESTELARQLHPDVILMDISMPVMSGIEASRVVLRDRPETKVILVSQNDAAVVSREAADVGASGYVLKNDLARDLLTTIEKAIGNTGIGRGVGDKVRALKTEDLANVPSVQSSVDCLAGTGEMAARMRALDWSQTPLGPIESWPQSLKTSVSICLASRFPIVMYWGPEYVVLYNDAYSTILGSKHPWALGQRCRDCWAEIWDTIGPMLNGVIRSGQATWSDDLLLPLRRRGYAEECYFSFSFSPIRVETGAVGGVFTAVIETTEKIIGERRLKTLHDLASRAVEAKTEVDAWRIASEVLAENLHDLPFAALCEVFGGQQIRILDTAGIPKDHPFCMALSTPGTPLFRHVRHVAETRDMREIQSVENWADSIPAGAWEDPIQSTMILPLGEPGLQRPTSILVAAVSPHKKVDDSYRAFFQLVASQIASSVADARSYEDERKRAQALAEIDRAKTVFFSNVSHEFRTPLTLMVGPLEDALAVREGLAPDQRERLETAHRNSLRLLKLVNTLLDFSRIEAGRIDARYEPIDLPAFTADLASVFRSASERAGLRLIINCEPMGEPVYVDREMWEKIVFNLISNALKFTFAGEIEVTLRKGHGAVDLVVRDTGTGIPPGELPHLFERFYRVKGAQGRSFEGSGIGLALVLELAKLHGGSVRVESIGDEGSIFTVSVPLGKRHLPADRVGGEGTQAAAGLKGEAYVQEALSWIADSQEVSEESQRTPWLSATGGLASPSIDSETRPRILLADDNADMREYVQRLLEGRYAVVAVADGQFALESARQRQPDLVLADVMMPRLDGFGLLRALRADENLKTIPVMLLSARAGEESRIEGLRAGADDYLIKPFSARELLARIDSQLSLAGLRRHAAELERELRRKAERFQALVNATSYVVYRMSPDWTEMRQLEGRGIISDTPKPRKDWMDEYIHPDDQPMVWKAIREAVRTKDVFQLEHRVRRTDGTLGWTHSRAIPMMDEKGEIVEWFGAASDVTERKEIEENYKDLAERLDAEVRVRTRELEERNAEILSQAEHVRELSWQLLHTQDEERRHIARELHDSAGQTLTVLGMNLGTLARKTSIHESEFKQTLAEANELVQQLTKEIRTTSYLLHPPLLDDNGLPAALSWYISGLTDRSGLNINFNISEDFGRLPRDMELAIFRVIQECLTNIHRHSGSKTASIQVLREPERLLIEIRDQGRGIPPEKLPEIRTKSPGLGIRGMRERLRQFNGEMIIESTRLGTTVLVTIPISMKQRDLARTAESAL